MGKQFSFTGTSKITLEYTQGEKTSKHISTDLRLDVGSGIDKKVYLDKDLPTKEGIKPLTLCFVHGLVGNIHSAHEKGYWDSAEHLRYIIAELERGFANPAIVSESRL